MISDTQRISKSYLQVICLCIAIFLFTACNSQSATVQAQLTKPKAQVLTTPTLTQIIPAINQNELFYGGWVYQAYPQLTQAQIEIDLRRLKEGGANVVWVGHNNPGEVAADMVEPGLSFAVYQEMQNPQSPKYNTAVAIIQAQHHLLQAARSVDLPVVFSIGYHSQMGQTWNLAHPQALRRDAQGELLSIFGGHPTASPYDPSFQADMITYYQWVAKEFIRPYQDIIHMVNLADEPLGGDYSAAAEAIFQARSGQTFASATPAQLGAFQDQVMVDFAIWNAKQWQKLLPDMLVTISFCGAQGRWSYHLPNVAALFRDTPSNFIPTFDAYLHDAPAHEPLTEAEVGALLLFARSLGHYSALYGRDLWLWSAGNRWGLAAESTHPGTVADAVANGYLLATAVRSTGGSLRGLAVWHSNLRHQGLFADEPAADPYNRDLLFSKVNQALPAWRTIMASEPGQTHQLIFYSDNWAQNWLGSQGIVDHSQLISFAALQPLSQVETPQAIVGQLDPIPPNIETIIILDPISDFISENNIEILQNFLADGGLVLAMPEVTAIIEMGQQTNLIPLPALPWQLSQTDWQNLLPETAVAQAGFHVSSPEHALFYQPGETAVSLPPYRNWRTFDSQGNPLAIKEASLTPHTFAINLSSEFFKYRWYLQYW